MIGESLIVLHASKGRQQRKDDECMLRAIIQLKPGLAELLFYGLVFTRKTKQVQCKQA
jgi:hypothetical protein